MKEAAFEVEGKVVKLERGRFIVQCDHGLVTCTLSGKMRTRKIRVVTGDTVTVEMGGYSVVNGRITKRL